jgi:hypothetical protein
VPIDRGQSGQVLRWAMNSSIARDQSALASANLSPRAIASGCDAMSAFSAATRSRMALSKRLSITRHSGSSMAQILSFAIQQIGELVASYKSGLRLTSDHVHQFSGAHRTGPAKGRRPVYTLLLRCLVGSSNYSRPAENTKIYREFWRK